MFRGMPVAKISSGAEIRLGGNVTILSRPDANPVGLPHPTLLAAVRHGSQIVIGSHVGISGASIVAASSITIGDRVYIGGGACIWDTDFHPLHPHERRLDPNAGACAPIRIEDEVFIGARSIILKGVTVGRGAVIGAGAVVTKDVPAGCIVAGNPARIVGAVDVQAVQCEPDRGTRRDNFRASNTKEDTANS